MSEQEINSQKNDVTNFIRKRKKTLIYVLITFFHLFKSKLKAIYFLASLVAIIAISQYILGIIMLKLFVPIHLGLSHQLGSLILLSSLIITKCEIIKKRAINRPSF